MTDWSYDAWPTIKPNWGGSGKISEWDELDFHVDLGAGTLKKGRIGVDRYPSPGINIVMDFETQEVYGVAENPGEDAKRSSVISIGLPFADNQIKSIISHHALEHVGEGFIPLVDEMYRVLEPGGILRAITPLFPSYSAVSDADHSRYFCEETWDAFCGTPGDTPQNCWLAGFSVPYTKARFHMIEKSMTPLFPPSQRWTLDDRREIRVTLQAMK